MGMVNSVQKALGLGRTAVPKIYLSVSHLAIPFQAKLDPDASPLNSKPNAMLYNAEP